MNQSALTDHQKILLSKIYNKFEKKGKRTSEPIVLPKKYEITKNVEKSEKKYEVDKRELYILTDFVIRQEFYECDFLKNSKIWKYFIKISSQKDLWVGSNYIIENI